MPLTLQCPWWTGTGRYGAGCISRDPKMLVVGPGMDNAEVARVYYQILHPLKWELQTFELAIRAGDGPLALSFTAANRFVEIQQHKSLPL